MERIGEKISGCEMVDLRRRGLRFGTNPIRPRAFLSMEFPPPLPPVAFQSGSDGAKLSRSGEVGALGVREKADRRFLKVNTSKLAQTIDEARRPNQPTESATRAVYDSAWRGVARRGGLAAWSIACRALQRREEARFSGGSDHRPAEVFGRELRVALVKQTAYADLYSNPSSTTPRDLLESSWHRTGPIGLFIHFDARFVIVQSEPDPECRVAEEKLAYALNDAARAHYDATRKAAQTAVAVRSESVDWSEFDVVIAIENAVPARVTRRFPRVLWATLLEHHRMAPFESYLNRPPAGYDAFLNLRYGPNPRSIHRRPHVIDWPYNFNVPDGLVGLYPEIKKEDRVFLEDHQTADVRTTFSARVGGPVADESEPRALSQFLKTMIRSKIFCAVSPSRPLGGLALIDAVASGCVVLADRSLVWNPFLVTAETDLRRVADAAEFAERVLSDGRLYSRIRTEQSRRLAWFCYERPLRQLADLIRKTPRALSAADHLQCA